jgi:hypothetical protein
MASSILSTASSAVEKAKEMTGITNAKVAQLAADTKDVHDKKWKMTSDFGVKQNNTDDWLKVATPDQQGPALLEDHFGREKVRSISTWRRLTQLTPFPRSTASTTNASPSALSTPVAPVPLENSPSLSLPKMSHLPVF